MTKLKDAESVKNSRQMRLPFAAAKDKSRMDDELKLMAKEKSPVKLKPAENLFSISLPAQEEWHNFSVSDPLLNIESKAYMQQLLPTQAGSAPKYVRVVDSPPKKTSPRKRQSAAPLPLKPKPKLEPMYEESQSYDPNGFEDMEYRKKVKKLDLAPMKDRLVKKIDETKLVQDPMFMNERVSDRELYKRIDAWVYITEMLTQNQLNRVVLLVQEIRRKLEFHHSVMRCQNLAEEDRAFKQSGIDDWYRQQRYKVCDLLPSNKGRQSLIQGLIKAYHLEELCDDVIDVIPCLAKDLASYHSEEFINHLLLQRGDDNDEELSKHDDRFGLVYDCYPFPSMAEYVRLTAGSSILTAKTIIERNKTSTGQVVGINWYGGRHHCHKSRASGFCYVNDIILGINTLRKHLGSVFYLDLDMHHGDGVESGFRFSKKIATCSVHRYDVGVFPGVNTYNVPTRKGLSDGSMRWIIDEIVIPLIERFGPKSIVIQAGCDGLATDEHKEWNMSIKGYADAISRILEKFDTIPTMILGGGGYNHTETAKCWTYITGKVLQAPDIDSWGEIPEHDKLDAYESDGFQFWTECNLAPGKMKDENTEEYLNEIKSYLLSL
ncbi:Histone deacetylase 8 [Candida viswanathii]|uniref:Histone deacetylase 8 n=1 Tax=Candida viswanathii TaxID=5486 RepID=A0A367XRT5_9ASCO|nr:Histone deacetylase 8 [Candida viswanathii]